MAGLSFTPTAMVAFFLGASDHTDFLIVSLGFSMYSIMSSANSESFKLLLFPSGFLLFFFPSLIAIARTSRTMLSKVVKVDTLALFLILEGVFSIFHL